MDAPKTTYAQLKTGFGSTIYKLNGQDRYDELSALHPDLIRLEYTEFVALLSHAKEGPKLVGEPNMVWGESWLT